MILQILSDAGQIGVNLDAVLLEMRGLADPGQHQDLRRTDGAGGQDDLFPCTDEMLAPGGVDIVNADAPGDSPPLCGKHERG